MKIYLGSDHAGYEFKEKVKKFLTEEGYDVEDCGARSYDPNDDYPDFIGDTARKVSENPGSFGLVFGKSGAGESMVANKIKGIRSFLAVNEENVKLAREHNNANIMSLGADFVSFQDAVPLITLFLTAPFSNEERHKRRLDKIKAIEQSS